MEYSFNARNNRDNGSQNLPGIKFNLYLTMALVSSGFFFNGNLMIWLSRLFFFDCPWSCLESRFNFVYMCYLVLPFVIMLLISPAFLYKNLNRYNMKWFFYYASFLLIGSWITIVLFGHLIPEVLKCVCLSVNLGIACSTFHLLIPTYIYDLTGQAYKARIDGILSAQFASGVLFQFGLSFLDLFDDVCLWLTISPVILFLFGLCVIPSSVRYLCIIGKPHESKIIMHNYRWSDTEIEQDIDCWVNSRDIFAIKEFLSNTVHLKRFLPLLSLSCLELVMGPLPILFYLNEILYSISRETALESDLLKAAAIGSGYLLGSCMAHKLHWYMEGWNYKRTLYVMLSIMALLLFGLSGFLHYFLSSSGGSNKKGSFFIAYQDIIPSLFLATILLVYAVGIRQSVAVLEAKLIPQNESLIFKTINTTTFWIAAPFVILVFLFSWRSIGVGWLLTYFALLCLLTMLYVCVFVPDPDEARLTDEDDDEDDMNIASTTDFGQVAQFHTAGGLDRVDFV